MKKRDKKLTLSRETLYRLEEPVLHRIRGGSGEATCGMCDSNLSCSEQAEDCCVGTMH